MYDRARGYYAAEYSQKSISAKEATFLQSNNNRSKKARVIDFDTRPRKSFIYI